MEEIKLTFNVKINVSLVPGDIVYYLDGSNIITLGDCMSVADDRLSCNVNRDSEVAAPAAGNYIFFSKPAEAESSGIIGYEATTTLINTSTERAELYSIASEVFQSSI